MLPLHAGAQEPCLAACRMEDTLIARCSDDFYPLDPASHTSHVGICAYNSIFMGALIQVLGHAPPCGPASSGLQGLSVLPHCLLKQPSDVCRCPRPLSEVTPAFA